MEFKGIAFNSRKNYWYIVYCTMQTLVTSNGCRNTSRTGRCAWPCVTLVICALLKLGPHDALFVFVMRHVSWFAHCVYEKICLIRVDVSFVHSSHLVRQLGGKLTHQSKLYVSDSTNLFDTFTHDAPWIRTTHRVDPA